MRRAAIPLLLIGLLVLALQGCTPVQLEPRVGVPTGHRWPQADEQCDAQPELEWC